MGVNHPSIGSMNTLARTMPPEMIRKKLIAMAQAMGVENFRIKAAREIVAGTKPERAVPEVYHPYRALVCDGIQFFLSHISLDRLLDVMVLQLRMDRQSPAEERLLELAKHFPTMHKLGQIIARNQNIEPGVRQWLIHLENGRYGTLPDDLLAHIGVRLNSINKHHGVQIDPHILSEASVGAVIPFKRRADGKRGGVRGVFKVLKPNIKEKLAEELAVFEKIAAFFEQHRHRYALKDFRFLDVFKDVAEILEKEVDLCAEQSHLCEAVRFYKDTDSIVIPDKLEFSDDTMTAMAHIVGEKITDAQMTYAQRRDCASTLAQELICRPIFAPGDATLFHGDPHAGNILWSAGSGYHGAQIALLDWSLAGHLTQGVRVKMVQFIKSVITDDHGQICRSIRSLAAEGSAKGALSRTGLRRTVASRLRSKDHIRFSLLKKAFWLLEHLSYEGVVFPKDLMLFRKAIFTLEGVLYDLDPQFNLDTFLFKYMGALIADEMPSRLGRTLFFQADKPENYQSLLSNGDLQMMMLNQYTAMIERHTRTAVRLLEKQTQIMRLMFN